MTKKIKKNNQYSKIEITIIAAIIIVIFSISIAYSIFNSTLYISGEATVRADVGTRITGVTLTSATNSAYESYKPIYNVDNITLNTCHPNLDSEITYTVTFQNNKANDVIITEIISSIYDNENINYEVSGLAVDDIISAGTALSFTVTLKYKDTVTTIPDAICLGLVLNVAWEDYYNNPLTATIDTTTGDTTTNTYGALFNVTVTNRNSKAVTFNFNSSSNYFAITDSTGATNEYTIAAKGTTTFPIYIKETTDSVFTNTTQNMDLMINISNIENADVLTVSTLTLTLPELPKYDMISDGYTEESESNIDYSNADSSSSGVYKTAGPGGGEVYFYRGVVTNNYVSFAGYTWRILQIDENGNLRVIMDGVIPSTTVQYRTTYSATDEATAIDLVHYNNSNAKTILDSWYNTNIASNSDYSSKVVPSKFCVDTSYSSHTSSGTQSSVNYFKSYQSIGQDVATYNPTLSCDSQYVITENIGLISAEEIVMAGGAYKKSNTSYFLYNSSITTNYWTISPAYWDNSAVHSVNVFVGLTNGGVTDWVNGSMLTNSWTLRPVITLDGSYNPSGTGTSSDPYIY